jgi:hypothetical protein
MSEPGTDLTIPDEHGELTPVKAASTERIAAFVDSVAERRSELAEWESVANDELLARLDADALWTQRVGDFEVKAPSPTAGTESYDAEELQAALRSLIERGTVSEDAASGALRRQLTLCLEVPWDASPADLAKQVEHAISIQVAGHDVRVLSASGSIVPVLAGINRLRKLAAAAPALDTAANEPVSPRRRVKVTRKTR